LAYSLVASLKRASLIAVMTQGKFDIRTDYDGQEQAEIARALGLAREDLTKLFRSLSRPGCDGPGPGRAYGPGPKPNSVVDEITARSDRQSEGAGWVFPRETISWRSARCPFLLSA
jgi:hypothetical protein